jgi:predicted ATPase
MNISPYPRTKTKYHPRFSTSNLQALSSAFDQFLDILIQKKSESDWAKWVINRLQAALGRDACYLLPLIPKLIKVLDVDMTHIDPTDQDPNNAMRRLQNLLCQFVDTVSKSSKVPVLFVCDDMQWADEASIALIYQMLRREHKSLCFLVCRRISTRHEPIWWMIDNATAAGINTTTVKLHRIERDALRDYLSDLMCLSPRIIRPLSDIVYKRTKGTPGCIVLIIDHDDTSCLTSCFDLKRQFVIPPAAASFTLS